MKYCLTAFSNKVLIQQTPIDWPVGQGFGPFPGLAYSAKFWPHGHAFGLHGQPFDLRGQLIGPCGQLIGLGGQVIGLSGQGFDPSGQSIWPVWPTD